MIDALLLRLRARRRPQAFRPSSHFTAAAACSVAGPATSELSEHHIACMRRLTAQGYAMLFPDSFTSRGHREVCTEQIAERSIKVGQRRLDVLGALEWLQHRKRIATDRIASMGWSHGGSTVLTSVDTRSTWSRVFARSMRIILPGGRCVLSGRLPHPDRWKSDIPVQVHIGELDDWTPAKPCVEMSNDAHSHGLPVHLYVYPHSYHAFDAPVLPLTLRRDVPNGVNPGHGVHITANPFARAAALPRVDRFLRSELTQ
jgi:dienelactone hydrolase